MNKKQIVQEALLRQKMLPLYYHHSAEISIGILQALFDAGVRLVEYTNRGEAALQNFKLLRAAVNEEMEGLLLGIGTIKTEEDAQAFIDAGADFIVCPTIHAGVGQLVQKAGLFWIPGCMTPTEIAAAESAGANMVKIFPGNILGAGYISAIKDLFPSMSFMPTGGVELEESNLNAWFASGVVAVGMGSKLITKTAMESGDYDGIRTATEKALALVKKASA
jgi:2-dehydro-3-deoxyphosphogluconate aldolase/(4S)-4-hydroxy-2-oxoglutarate aldolase